MSRGPAPVAAERSAARPVSRPHDVEERQAERAAEVVGRGGTVADWSFSSVPMSASSPVQRDDLGGGPHSEEEEIKEAAAAAAGEVGETEQVKPIKEKAARIAKSPGGATALAGALVTLGVTGRGLPVPVPVSLGGGWSLSADVEGPLRRPTGGMATVSYRPQWPKGRRAGGSDREQQREETGRRAAEAERFRQGMRRASGVSEAEELREAEEMFRRTVSPSSRLPRLYGQPRKEDERSPLLPLQRQTEPGGAHDHAAAAPRGGPVDAALAGGGRLLDAPVRGLMEARFGHDFSRVRVHDDARAAEAAASVRAAAFTVGTDVFFAPGRYHPSSPDGRRVLAHELAHVVQQSGGGGSDTARAVEHDAARGAEAALRGRPARLRARAHSAALYCFGEPDHVPDLTFVSTSGEPGFLDQAVQFHRTWGLDPRRFNSMQHLLSLLAGATGSISRLRIVSHADFDNIFTPLFTGGSAGISENDLLAFAESDSAGLRHVLGRPMVATPALTGQVLDDVRQNNAAALAPFGLDQLGATPAGPVARLIEATIELQAIRTATGGIPADQRTTLEGAVAAELTGLRAEVQQAGPAGTAPTATEVQNLEAAVRTANLPTWTMGPQDAGYTAAVRTATAGLGQGFRTNLEAVRGRLSTSSWIDIRGCRVGQRPPYLGATARFFGSARNQPHVSGPDWFQSYPQLGFRTVTDANLDALAGASDVQAALAHWGGVTGVRARMLWWLAFYTRVLLDDLRAPAASDAPSPFGATLPTPPALSGGLQLSPDPLLMPLAVPPLEEPTFGRRPAAGVGLRTPRLVNPLVAVAERELRRYSGPAGELRYYLDAGLPLPVQEAANVENINLLIKSGGERQALDAWLNSQWEPAAPGLPALLRGNWQRDQLRQVEAVSELDAQRRPTAMFVSPDPRYAEHIKTS